MMHNSGTLPPSLIDPPPPSDVENDAQLLAAFSELPEWYFPRLVSRFGPDSTLIGRLAQEHAELARRTTAALQKKRRRS